MVKRLSSHARRVIVERLFPHAQIFEMEVFSFGWWKLASVVHAVAQVLHNAVVAVLAWRGFTSRHEFCVAIFMFASGWDHYHAFKVKRSFIPALACLGQQKQWVVRLSASVLGYVWCLRAQSFFLFEIKHGVGHGLDDDEIYVRPNLVAFWKKNVAGRVVPDVCLHLWRDINVLNAS